jgi:hypothetical protein
MHHGTLLPEDTTEGYDGQTNTVKRVLVLMLIMYCIHLTQYKVMSLIYHLKNHRLPHIHMLYLAIPHN